MGIYLDSGYLDQKWIEEQADKNGINFIIEIGGRQVGKTWGVTELMLREEKTFILMRRTKTEAEFICNDINSPFTCHQWASVKVKKESDYTGRITREIDGQEKQIGTVMSLSTVAKIRGFDGSMYSDLVFDEFIPENHVMKIKNEGDAFLNAIVSISGNRELEDRPPLRTWLLANANNIGSPILQALNIQSKIDEMKRLSKELSILTDRGILIVLPNSTQLMERRKKTALMRAISPDSNFTKMAFENEFAYNDPDGVGRVNLGEYKPVFTIDGRFTVYTHKNRTMLYVTRHKAGSCRQYGNTERELIKCRRDYPNLNRMYIGGKTLFSDLVTKTDYIDFLQN